MNNIPEETSEKAPDLRRTSYALSESTLDAFNLRVPYGIRGKVVEALLLKFLSGEVKIEFPAQTI